MNKSNQSVYEAIGSAKDHFEHSPHCHKSYTIEESNMQPGFILIDPETNDRILIMAIKV